ncbi:MAG: von Willebrand factor type A domain-containing protein, partial [Clostridia bacterium]|nr:von Willebrand factor type A domain-containing protein [Clostridia bacterium]
MKKKIVFIAAACMAVACLSVTACNANHGGGYYSGDSGLIFGTTATPDGNNYQYGSVTETPFVDVNEEGASYFSLDRNTAGYSYVRAQLNRGYQISPTSVRVEELINYFDYSYPQPENDAVAVSTYLSDCPWNAENKLVTVGVTTRYESIEAENGNYVFLIDVSGSMSGDDRIGLARYGFN